MRPEFNVYGVWTQTEEEGRQDIKTFFEGRERERVKIEMDEERKRVYLTQVFCLLLLLDHGQVSWVRQSDLHILTSGLTAYTSDSRFQAHHSTTSNDWILEIRDLKWTDAGSFFPFPFLFLSSNSF